MQFQTFSLEQKRKNLRDACAKLKTEFIGLDEIIDEIGDIVLPWYLFPEHQMRPLIVNLWGMTGSGKTALIKRLSELLNYNNLLLRFDMGEFGNNSTFLKYALTGQLEQFNGLAPIVVLDEFQFAKTKDENGKEVNNTALRVIWDLLDSGELLYDPSVNSYYISRAKKVLKILKHLQKIGVKISKGVITTHVQAAHEQLSNLAFGYSTGENDNKEEVDKVFAKPSEYLLSDLFCTGYYEIVVSKYNMWQEVREHIQQLDSINDLIEGLAIDMEEAIALRKMDLSKSLIFVVGNLDEAYSMSHNINPDIDADEFRRHTLKINIADIKAALQNRFRNEQIARLGNNHLIYHAFSNKQFQQLIKMHLGILAKQIQSRFKLKVTFTQSVHDMLYAEGVFPTQGVRPVISTIRNHIESNITKIMLYVSEQKKPCKKIQFDFVNGQFVITLDNGSTMKMPVVQKINSLRTSTKTDLQAIVAVHESGHTLASMFIMGIVPEYVITRTVESDTNGFAYTIIPEEVGTKRLLIDRICVLLGGYAAEQFIFGEENNTTGVYDDFNRATQIAHQIIRDYGMLGLPYKLNIHAYGGNPYQFTYTEKDEQAGIAIMNDCLAVVLDTLKNHKPFLLMLSKYLSDNSRIDKQQITAMYMQYCKQHKVAVQKFVDKDSYYNFRKKLHQMR
ncbi:MAG: hypothetical protein RL660_2124 [Bacteroidota bacterium]|jgi:cell division protease FtsH